MIACSTLLLHSHKRISLLIFTLIFNPGRFGRCGCWFCCCCSCWCSIDNAFECALKCSHKNTVKLAWNMHTYMCTIRTGLSCVFVLNAVAKTDAVPFKSAFTSIKCWPVIIVHFYWTKRERDLLSFLLQLHLLMPIQNAKIDTQHVEQYAFGIPGLLLSFEKCIFEKKEKNSRNSLFIHFSLSFF